MRKHQIFTLFAFCCTLWVACGESEIRETFHYNGIRKTRVAYKDGRPDGKFKRWTSHGDLAESGDYLGGKRVGKWTEWYANGNVLSEGRYKNGEKHGEWKGFFMDGSLSWVRFYDLGKPVGTWTEYHPIPGSIDAGGKAGKIKERNSCFPDTPEGLREVFSASGKKVREEHCRFGRLDGTVTEFYPGGAVENRSEYREGLLDGISERFRATGELWRRGFYKKSVRDSAWTYFAKDGTVAKESFFEDGTGKAFGELGKNGFDAETTFVKNLVEDTLRYRLPGRDLDFEEIWETGEKKKLLSRYPSGELASEGNFSGGKRNGHWRNWYSNGKIKDSLFYKDGEPFGEWLHFDSTGKLYMKKHRYGKNGPMEVLFNR